jgi:hypothetical protein
VSLEGDTLVAVAPGQVRARVISRGLTCEESIGPSGVGSGCAQLSVSADLTGSWHITCDNGDEGIRTVAGPWPAQVWPAGTGAYLGQLSLEAASCMSNDNDDFSCANSAPFAVTSLSLDNGGPFCGEPFESSGSGPCSEERPCSAYVPNHCASPRHDDAGLILGADRLRLGDCDYARGSRRPCIRLVWDCWAGSEESVVCECHRGIGAEERVEAACATSACVYWLDQQEPFGEHCVCYEDGLSYFPELLAEFMTNNPTTRQVASCPQPP